MSALDKLSHAKHNYSICQYLNSADINCNDWVVTTAFYSAIHFCQKGLFPGDYFVDSTNKELSYYNSFEEFFKAFKVSSEARKYASPHRCRRWLIENQIDEISFGYCALADVCHIARYKNYKINDKDKNDALTFLEDIKAFCD